MDYMTTSELFEAIERSAPKDLKERFYNAVITYAHLRAELYVEKGRATKEMKGRLKQSDKELVNAWDELVRQAGQETGLCKAVEWDHEKLGSFACYLHFIMSVLAFE